MIKTKFLHILTRNLWSNRFIIVLNDHLAREFNFHIDLLNCHSNFKLLNDVTAGIHKTQLIIKNLLGPQ